MAAGDAALAQQHDGQDSSETQSRLLPHPSSDGPPAMISLGQMPSSGSPTDEPPKLASLADFADGARTCMRTVSPEMQVNTQYFWDEHWSYTKPEKLTTSDGTFETIQYDQNDVTISLLDYGRVVICRVGAWTSSSSDVPKIRASLVEELGARPLRQVPELAEMSDFMAQQMPQVDQANVLTVGSYQLEIASKDVDLAQEGIKGGKATTIVMLTIVPLSKKYQARLKVGTGK